MFTPNPSKTPPSLLAIIYLVHSNSFLNILGVGKTRYTNLHATRFTPGMNTHKNSGNSHAAMTAGTKQSVIDFINQKGKE
jgi:hypothetical protein